MKYINKKIQNSSTISNNNNFIEFVKNNNISLDIDKPSRYMYDLDNKTHTLTQNNSVYYLTSSEAAWINKDLHDKQIEYRLNNNGHRCDDFKEDREHRPLFLFAGCSTTFGQGIPLELSWPKILFNKINNSGSADNFYSISFPGGSSFKIINNIFKFCKKYGNPKFLFVLLPDYMRQDRYRQIIDRYRVYENIKIIGPSNSQILEEREKDFIFDEEGFFLMYNMINILETFCEYNNIKLYLSSWDELSNKRLLELGVNRYFDIEYDKAQPFYDDMLLTHDIINNKYLKNARDGMHPGYMVHSYTANKFLKYFEEDKND